jgi:hypothetical protein
MAINQQAAEGVQALAQTAQQAAPVAQQAGVQAAAAGDITQAPPTMQQSFQQEFAQPLIDQNVRAMRPDYGDPNEWSYAGDAMALAFKDAQPGQNAIDMLLNNFGQYGQQAAAQRNAIAAGDVGAIQEYQAGTDPLLDVMIDWEMPQGRSY